MLGFDEFETLAKDSMIFPKFSTKVAKEAQEQTLRTITNLLVAEKGDYRDIFTTRKTFLTPLLASVYGVPLLAPDGGWRPYEFPAGDSRGGVISQVCIRRASFPSGAQLADLARQGGTRGSIVPARSKSAGQRPILRWSRIPRTRNTRRRGPGWARMRTDATCAGCHKIMDPIGLGLEAFDFRRFAAQQRERRGYRHQRQSRRHQVRRCGGSCPKRCTTIRAAPSCVVSRTMSYGLGRLPVKSEGDWG